MFSRDHLYDSKREIVVSMSSWNRETDNMWEDSKFDGWAMHAAPSTLNMKLLNYRKTNRSNHEKYHGNILDKRMRSLLSIL